MKSKKRHSKVSAILRASAILPLAFLSSLAIAAGFDCSNAASNIEKTICASDALSSLDAQLTK